tara:strand:+ start:127 stop:474 length:348 start_codon:yes stop_codon:yes gene_type:complete
MRRTASEILSDLENRIARLERQSASTFDVVLDEGGSRGYYRFVWKTNQIVKKVVEEGFDEVITSENGDSLLFSHQNSMSAGVMLKVKGGKTHLRKILNAIENKGGKSIEHNHYNY